MAGYGLQPRILASVRAVIKECREGHIICKCGHPSAVHYDLTGSSACALKQCLCSWLRLPEGVRRESYSEALAYWMLEPG